MMISETWNEITICNSYLARSWKVFNAVYNQVVAWYFITTSFQSDTCTFAAGVDTVQNSEWAILASANSTAQLDMP